VNGRRYAWEAGVKVEIGRDPTCDVVLDDPKVSRVHARVEATPDGAWQLVDAGSTNGIWVDGRRVAQLAIGSSMTVSLDQSGTGAVVELVLSTEPEPEQQPQPERHPAAVPEPRQAAVPVPQAAVPVPQAAVPQAAVPQAQVPQAQVPQAQAQAVQASGPATEQLRTSGPGDQASFGRLSNVYEPTGNVVTIGRETTNDVVLADDPRASRRHAELRLGSDGSWVLKDLGSHNGTFLNGERVSQGTLSDGDIVALGNHVFRFHAGKLEQFSASDDTSLDVARLKVVTEGGTTLIEDVAFSLPSRSVLAIVGPSGAGKTTLLRALNGFGAPTEGGVRFAGRDLYGAYDELRSRIGYVPQDDLVHPQLTIRQELESAAALRLPPDLGKQGRMARVDRVTHELGLTQRADLRIDKLSGGQRKRASLAIELLTEPALLFLGASSWSSPMPRRA
jgi:pSer/pThr/pTyr-binding forkhead associated (FHA) protein